MCNHAAKLTDEKNTNEAK